MIIVKMTDEIPSRFPQQSRGLFGFMERRQSPRSSGEHPVCETCQHTVEPSLVNRCHGCNQYAHRECRETMSIGVTWRVEMCISCTSYVRQLLRIVRATEARRFRGWDEEFWFGSVIRACHNVGTMLETSLQGIKRRADLHQGWSCKWIAYMAVTFVGITYGTRRSVSTRFCGCKGEFTFSNW